jgi:hypothetical protein
MYFRILGLGDAVTPCYPFVYPCHVDIVMSTIVMSTAVLVHLQGSAGAAGKCTKTQRRQLARYVTPYGSAQWFSSMHQLNRRTITQNLAR